MQASACGRTKDEELARTHLVTLKDQLNTARACAIQSKNDAAQRMSAAAKAAGAEAETEVTLQDAVAARVARLRQEVV